MISWSRSVVVRRLPSFNGVDGGWVRFGQVQFAQYAPRTTHELEIKNSIFDSITHNEYEQ